MRLSLINISLVDSGQEPTHVVAYTVMSPLNILTNRCEIFFAYYIRDNCILNLNYAHVIFSPIQCTHIFKKYQL